MDEIDDPLVRRWNNFGMGIHPSELHPSSWPRLNNRYAGLRHWPDMRELCELRRAGHEMVHSTMGKDGFQVCLDVQQFAPNEITVKTTDDTNTIVVEAKHEEREDEHGYISRQFIRRYTLPKGYDAKDVVSQLSSDGILTIEAPPPVKASDEGNERIVQIQQTGPARLTLGNKEMAKKD